MFSHIHPDNYDAQLSKKQQDMATLFSVFNLPAPDLYPSAPLITAKELSLEFGMMVTICITSCLTVKLRQNLESMISL